jgi:predicted nucleotidyltransferase
VRRQAPDNRELPAPEVRIIERLKAMPEVQRIYLFGSRARGDAAPRADIDIAVACPSASEEQWLHIWDEVEQTETLLFIDVVRFEEASDDLKARILNEGRVIYERG